MARSVTSPLARPAAHRGPSSTRPGEERHPQLGLDRAADPLCEDLGSPRGQRAGGQHEASPASTGASSAGPSTIEERAGDRPGKEQRLGDGEQRAQHAERDRRDERAGAVRPDASSRRWFGLMAGRGRGRRSGPSRSSAGHEPRRRSRLDRGPRHA